MIQAEALRAPSRAQSPDASKAPVARAATASMRAWSTWRATMDSLSARADGSISASRVEYLGEVVKFHESQSTTGV